MPVELREIDGALPNDADIFFALAGNERMAVTENRARFPVGRIVGIRIDIVFVIGNQQSAGFQVDRIIV